MPIDDWVQFLQDTLKRLVDVTVPLEFLRHVLSPIVPMFLYTTRANALSILRSTDCSSKFLGRTLATQVSRQVLSEVAEVPVPLLGGPAVLAGTQQDLLNSLSQLHGPRDEEESLRPTKKAKRDPQSLREQKQKNTLQCLWVLENRIAFHVDGKGLVECERLDCAP